MPSIQTNIKTKGKTLQRQVNRAVSWYGRHQSVRILANIRNTKIIYDGKESHADNIPPDEWFNHFKALALKNIELNQEKKSLQDEIAEQSM